ncbi:IS4 family transposase, partial [Bacillus sp. 2205SS5-2]|uniref:IS4 family transposase n=2 Tax=Bacillus sp. 2205SS5-2 TaxID=3109031 RepID=UPI0030057C55
FQLFLIAQLTDSRSLNRLEKKAKNKKELQLFMEFDTISASQLSRKQGSLSSDLFEKVFSHLVFKIQGQVSKNHPIFLDIGCLHVIDSSTMTMSFSEYPWATYQKTKAGVRLHLRVVVTKEFTVPDRAVLLPATHSDRSQMEELIEIDPDAIQLFDRGYNDYKQYDRLSNHDVRFITRLKKNAKIEVLNEQAPDPENHIFQDQEVYLGDDQNDTKMKNSLRLIRTKDSEQNDIILLTNCVDLSAKEVGDLYRYRWRIETFFKWMKQHLKIKTFYGKSQNAVYTQIWIALITYCLQVLLKLKLHHEGPLLDIKTTLQDLLFDPIEEFIRSLFRKPTRDSKGRKKYDWEKDFQFIVQAV